MKFTMYNIKSFCICIAIHIHVLGKQTDILVQQINACMFNKFCILHCLSPSVVIPVSIPNEHSTVSLVEVALNKLSRSGGPFQVGRITQCLVGMRESTDH